MTRALPAWLALPAAAAVWWLVGFLPWLVHGAHRTAPTGGPSAPDQGAAGIRTAVPLLSEELAALITMAVLGGTAAGGLTRRWRGPERFTAAASAAVGVSIAAFLALFQSHRAASAMSGAFASDPRVLPALVTLAVGATVAGLAAGLLAGIGPTWILPVALAAPAALLPGWVHRLLSAQTDITTWLFAAALGTVLAVGVTRPAHLLAWMPAAAIAWATQAAIPALVVISSMIRPGSGLADNPWLPAQVGGDVFRAALTEPQTHLPVAWAVALTLAGTILAIRSRVGVTSGRRPPLSSRRSQQPVD